MRHRVARLQRQRALETRQRVCVAAQILQGDAEIAVCDGLAVVNGNRLPDQGERALRIAALARQNPAQMQGIEIARIGGQHLIVQSLRASEIALLMQRHRLLQQ